MRLLCGKRAQIGFSCCNCGVTRVGIVVQSSVLFVFFQPIFGMFQFVFTKPEIYTKLGEIKIHPFRQGIKRLALMPNRKIHDVVIFIKLSLSLHRQNIPGLNGIVYISGMILTKINDIFYGFRRRNAAGYG